MSGMLSMDGRGVRPLGSEGYLEAEYWSCWLFDFAFLFEFGVKVRVGWNRQVYTCTV